MQILKLGLIAMNNNQWLLEFNQNISREREKLSERDLRFFQLERLMKISRHIETNHKECEGCLVFKPRILELSENFSRYVHGNIKEKVHYEEIFDNAFKHMKNTHGLYPSFHFTYHYTFKGLMAGLAAGTFTFIIFRGIFEIQLILITALAGIIFGQVFGRRKDNQIRRAGKKI